MQFDLEERLLKQSAEIVRLTEKLQATRAGNHIANQLLRAGTSALPNHGEAEAAESRGNFIHKLSIGHKELREACRWLRLIQRVPLMPDPSEVDGILQETEALIRIFAASIRTAKANANTSCREEPDAYENSDQVTELLKFSVGR